MAVDKELLERDLYGLLGIGEKASEKEVRGQAARDGFLLSPPLPSSPCPGVSGARCSRLLSRAELRGCSKRCRGTGAIQREKHIFTAVGVVTSRLYWNCCHCLDSALCILNPRL